MALDEGKNDDEKLDFTAEGEVPGYISLDQAQVLAMRTARESPGAYGKRFRDTTMAFDVVEAIETEDHYVITISLRPEGEFAGKSGREQFFIEKEGDIALRQVLSLPQHESRRRSVFAVVAIGFVVIVAAAAVGGVLATRGGGNDNPGPVAALLPVGTPEPPPPATAPFAAPKLAGAAASTPAPISITSPESAPSENANAALTPVFAPTATALPPLNQLPTVSLAEITSATRAPGFAPTVTALPHRNQSAIASPKPASGAFGDDALPVGSVEFREHYYLTVPRRMTWVNAVAYSRSIGGHLVTISDQDENRFVADLAEERGLTQTFWIGLSDEAQEGRFLWVTGESTIYTNWSTGQPDNSGLENTGNEDYAAMGFETRYTWKDLNAESSWPFVVEFEPKPDAGTMAIGTSTSTPGTNQPSPRDYADRILTYEPLNVPPDPNLADPIRALGPPDNKSISLGGNGSFLEVEFTDNTLYNDAAADLRVVELGGAELYDVYVWTSESLVYVGTGQGTTDFDLGKVRIDGPVTIVRIVDRSPTDIAEESPGSDIDAIIALNSGPLP